MTSQNSSRKAGRPSKPLLTRSIIVDAALRVIERVGSDGFTLRRVAKELNVQAPALYNHFGNKSNLIDAMRERLARKVDVSSFEDNSWDEAIFPWAHSYRGALIHHPETVALLATKPVRGEDISIGNYEAITKSLLRGGWPEECVLPIIVALESFLLGSALDASAPDDIMDPGWHAAEVPVFAAAERVHRAAAHKDGVRPADRAFDLGLKSMVYGLRKTLDEDARS